MKDREIFIDKDYEKSSKEERRETEKKIKDKRRDDERKVNNVAFLTRYKIKTAVLSVAFALDCI